MCEDCPIYEGYPTSVLGWDEDDEEDEEPKEGSFAGIEDEEPCQWCQSVGCRDGELGMDGGFCVVPCICECHKPGEQRESEEG